MIGVTVVCVCLGIAVKFPVVSWWIFWYYSPAIAVSVGLSMLSSQRVATFALGVVASFLGALIGAVLFTNTFSVFAWSANDPPTAWEWYWAEDMPIQVGAVVAAVVVGVLWLQFFPRRKQSHQRGDASVNEQTPS
jgi:hypothetical protein